MTGQAREDEEGLTLNSISQAEVRSNSKQDILNRSC